MSDPQPLETSRPHADVWLVAVALALLGAGLVMVFSASQAISYLYYHSSFYLFFRQVAFAALGLVGMVVASRIDYHLLRRWAPLGFAAAVLLMLLVLVPGIGAHSYGAQRWISLGPLGTVEPSEVAKLMGILYMSHWVASREGKLDSFTDGFLPFGLISAGVIAILALQRDLGTSIVLTAILLTIYFTGGAPKRYLALLILTMAGAAVALVAFENYRMQRLAIYLHPFSDPFGNTYQPFMGLVALGSGGINGVGLGHSVQKFQWLPQAHTDFIFAIVGEETGLIGCTLLIAGFVLLAARGYRAAMRAPDRYGVMVAAGITTWITFQTLINMGVVTDTLPITGVPLPFVSSGGTSLAVTLTAVGVLFNISGQGIRSGGRSRRTHAAADSGRRDGGAPVPGAGSGAGVSG